VRYIDEEQAPILYVGDIHGFYQDLEDAFTFARNKQVQTMVFLGDYSDRGPNQLKSLVKVMDAFARSEGYTEYGIASEFITEKKYPFQIIALRGNHEDTEINVMYGLKEELLYTHKFSTFPEQQLSLLYSHLPLVSTTPWKTIGIHGGIPKPNQGELVSSVIQRLNILKTPITIDLSMFQLLWNDPIEGMEDQQADFTPSFRGPEIFQFNKAALVKFLEHNQYKRLVRAHQTVKEGGKARWNDILIHIFGTSPYFGRIQNKGYFLENRDGTGEIIDEKGNVLKTVNSFI